MLSADSATSLAGERRHHHCRHFNLDNPSVVYTPVCQASTRGNQAGAGGEGACSPAAKDGTRPPHAPSPGVGEGLPTATASDLTNGELWNEGGTGSSGRFSPFAAPASQTPSNNLFNISPSREISRDFPTVHGGGGEGDGGGGEGDGGGGEGDGGRKPAMHGILLTSPGIKGEGNGGGEAAGEGSDEGGFGGGGGGDGGVGVAGRAQSGLRRQATISKAISWAPEEVVVLNEEEKEHSGKLSSSGGDGEVAAAAAAVVTVPSSLLSLSEENACYGVEADPSAGCLMTEALPFLPLERLPSSPPRVPCDVALPAKSKRRDAPEGRGVPGGGGGGGGKGLSQKLSQGLANGLTW